MLKVRVLIRYELTTEYDGATWRDYTWEIASAREGKIRFEEMGHADCIEDAREDMQASLKDYLSDKQDEDVRTLIDIADKEKTDGVSVYDETWVF